MSHSHRMPLVGDLLDIGTGEDWPTLTGEVVAVEGCVFCARVTDGDERWLRTYGCSAIYEYWWPRQPPPEASGEKQ